MKRFLGLLTAAAIVACADQPTPTGSALLAAPGDSTGDTTGSNPNPGRVASITIIPAAESIAVGDTAALFADARDAAGNQVTKAHFRWTIGDPNVAQVEGDFGSSLILRALHVGTTTVTARSQGTTGSAILVVVESLPPPPPDSNQVATVTVSPPVDSASVGDSASFLATLRDSLGNIVIGPGVFWSVSDSTVAQIDGVFGTSVLLRALSPGTARITATSQGKSGSGTFVVR